MVTLALCGFMACLAVWLAGEVAAVVTSGAWPAVPVTAAVGIAIRLVADPSSPASAWPIGYRGLVPGPPAFYATLALVAVLEVCVAVMARRLVLSVISYIAGDVEAAGSSPVPPRRLLHRVPRRAFHQPSRWASRWAGHRPEWLDKLLDSQRDVLDRCMPGHGGGTRPKKERREAPRLGLALLAGRSRHGAAYSRGAKWASGRDLEALRVSGASAGRVILGRSGRDLLAVESRHSVLVVGPTQTYKTSGFAIPAILEWQGPVVAVSVKGDLMRDTVQWRLTVGDVWIYDPGSSLGAADGVAGVHAGCAGEHGAGGGCAGGDGTSGRLPVHALWSPLESSRTWLGARQAAARLAMAGARQDAPGVTDSTFWYATASKLLAPMFFAAAISGRDMRDVVRWIDTREVTEVMDVLSVAGVPEAMQAAQASWDRDERQLSSVYTTAETVLSVFADLAPTALSTPSGTLAPSGSSAFTAASAPSTERSLHGMADIRTINPRLMCDGRSRTLYVCSPAHEQRHFQLLFVALLEEVLQAAFSISNAQGKPLDPPLLVVLDEAAHVAPLPDLDELASTAASHGVQLITVWQDMSQLAARYGARASTVMNNHRAKIFLSGISDPATLEHTSQLVGDEEVTLASTTMGEEGSRSTTLHPVTRRLLPGDALRRMPPGHGMLLYGHLPPAQIALRPWFDDRRLSRRRASDVHAVTG